MKIRNACKEDAKQLIAIYAPYVEKTAITFEYQVPSLEEFEERIEKTKQKFPYLVAEEEGILQGYAMLQLIIIVQLMIGRLNYLFISEKKLVASILAVNFMLV